MRSRLTSSKPAWRAQSTTAGTRIGSWVRSSVRSTWSTADCMPKLIRLKPAVRSSWRSQAATLSGLASVVISTSSARPNSAGRARQDGAEVGRLQQRRRTSAEEDRVDLDVAVAQHVAGEADLADRRLGVRRPAGADLVAELVGGVGVEVAVAAAHAAERHVDVEAERPAAELRPRLVGEQAVLGREVAVGLGGGHGRHPTTQRAPRARQPTSGVHPVDQRLVVVLHDVALDLHRGGELTRLDR